MNLLGLGGGKFSDIEKDMQAQHWIEEAEKIIEKENLALHFNSNEIKDLNNTGIHLYNSSSIDTSLYVALLSACLYL